MLFCEESGYSRWQHIGNKKSDSPYPMENTDNKNNTYHIAQTKLFKSSFQGASGNKKTSKKKAGSKQIPLSAGNGSWDGSEGTGVAAETDSSAGVSLCLCF